MSDLKLKGMQLPITAEYYGYTTVITVKLSDGVEASTDMMDKVCFLRNGKYYKFIKGLFEPVQGSPVTFVSFDESKALWICEIPTDSLFIYEAGKSYMSKIEEAAQFFKPKSLKFSELMILLEPIKFSLTTQGRSVEDAFTERLVDGLSAYQGSWNGASHEEKEQWTRLMILYGSQMADAILALRNGHKIELVGSVPEGSFTVDGIPMADFLAGSNVNPFDELEQKKTSSLGRLAGMARSN